VIVAHVDLDAFFAAVEELEEPALREVPLVVGGDPHGRGVVATANYRARSYGIHSAMSCAEALRRCPHATFVRPRHSLYQQYSEAVWDAVAGVVPAIERTGLDEGYLDLSRPWPAAAPAGRSPAPPKPRAAGGTVPSGAVQGTVLSCPAPPAARQEREGAVATDFGRARVLADAVRTAVRGATSLSCSLGVGTSKVVAKVASDRRKPGGITVVLPGREAAFLAPFDLRLLPGIGPRTEARLRGLGIETLGALAALSDADLAALLPGKVGRILRDRAQGIDPRGLEAPSESVSISHEETFARDVADRAVLHAELQRMAERLGEHLVASGRAARTVTTKVRYTDFSIRSRSTSLAVGTDDGARIGDLACALLDRALADRPGALRLVGVGVSNLELFRQLTIAADEPAA
jgi:DNA polymerase-4